MNGASEYSARGGVWHVEAHATTIPSLSLLIHTLRMAADAATPCANGNAYHAQAALVLVEDAASRVGAGKSAVMAPMRAAAQHLRAVQWVSSEAERQAFADARRSMSATLFDASNLPG